jgi:hypothetical protein
MTPAHLQPLDGDTAELLPKIALDPSSAPRGPGSLTLAMAKAAVAAGDARKNLGVETDADLARAVAWSLFQTDTVEPIKALALIAGWPAVISALDQPLRLTPLSPNDDPSQSSSVGDLVWLRGRIKVARALSRQGWMKQSPPDQIARHVFQACIKRLNAPDPWIPIDGVGTSMAWAIRQLRHKHATQAQDMWIAFAPAARWRCAPLAEALRERDWLPMSGHGSLDALFPNGWDTPGHASADLSFLKRQIEQLQPPTSLSIARKLATLRAKNHLSTKTLSHPLSKSLLD